MRIGHRAACALYELHTELNAGMSWHEFTKLVQSSKTLHNKIQRVAGTTVIGLDASQLNFELPPEWHEEHPNEDLLYTPVVISEVVGQGMIEALFLKCVTEHFQRLAAAAKGYTWDAYMSDLTNDNELWGRLTRGLQHGIYQMDFKATWKDKAAQEQILSLEFD